MIFFTGLIILRVIKVDKRGFEFKFSVSEGFDVVLELLVEVGLHGTWAVGGLLLVGSDGEEGLLELSGGGRVLGRAVGLGGGALVFH